MPVVMLDAANAPPPVEKARAERHRFAAARRHGAEAMRRNMSVAYRCRRALFVAICHAYAPAFADAAIRRHAHCATRVRGRVCR